MRMSTAPSIEISNVKRQASSRVASTSRAARWATTAPTMKRQTASAIPMGRHVSARRLGATMLRAPEPATAAAPPWSHARAARWPTCQAALDRITEAMRIPAPPFGPRMPRAVSSATTATIDPLAMRVKPEKSIRVLKRSMSVLLSVNESICARDIEQLPISAPIGGACVTGALLRACSTPEAPSSDVDPRAIRPARKTPVFALHAAGCGRAKREHRCLAEPT